MSQLIIVVVTEMPTLQGIRIQTLAISPISIGIGEMNFL